MKAYLFILPLLTAPLATTSAQQIPRQAIEDSVIGWMKVYKFTGPRAPMTVDAKHYSAAQLSIMDSLANWIQASYTPKGALGDVIRAVAPKLGPYNKNDAALPQSYGAYAKTYFELKYDANRKMVPYTNSHLTWSIRANQVFGEPLLVLNTPTQYYFLLPNLGKSAGRVKPETERYDMSQHPAVKRYVTYFNDQLNSTTANATYVVLSKDNTLPFIVISKAEYLEKMAGAIERKYAAEKEYAVRGWPEGNARANALKDADARYQKRQSVLASNREKYAGRLQEAAAVFSLQPDELLENVQDVFEGNGGTAARYPVYKIDPVKADLAKTDQPQWILVWWDGDLLDPVGKQQIDAILNNFDFQYVHDFFFAPENVRGRSYRPLRSPDARAAVVVAEASEAVRSNAADAKVHFFEDFSTTPIGRPPNGWSVGRTTGTIANLDGLPGNWAVMAGDARLTPKLLKTPLPQDFTLTYELVAAQNFTWGAKGLTLQLANETTPGNAESYLQLKLRPGFDGKDGEAVLETRFPPGYQSGTKWLVATGFSNNKQNNHITVSIRKAGETLQVFIDAQQDRGLRQGDSSRPVVQRDVVLRAGQSLRAERQVLPRQDQNQQGIGFDAVLVRFDLRQTEGDEAVEARRRCESLPENQGLASFPSDA